METVRRVAVVNDLSGFGRCSLTVALPILAAMGFQPCPVPTVLLSAHTGYVSPYISDFTDHMAPYLQHWESMDLTFDGVYTGFLGNEKQIDLLLPLLQRTKGLRMVDPAMADHGRLYATCTPQLVEEMKKLVELATVTTPNLTEACLLAGEEYDAVMALSAGERRQRVEELGRRLRETGCEAVVITGVPEDTQVSNMVLTDAGEAWVSACRVERNFAGTGDVFSAVLCGYLLRGEPLVKAARLTADFVSQVTAHTAALGAPEQDGIVFEPFLKQLCK